MLQGTPTRAEGAPDLVITNVVVLDHWGIVKCDVGIRDGRIVALGKAGNPDIADGVHPDARDRRRRPRSSPARGGSSPPAAIDCHVHFICPQIVDEAVAAGHDDADRRRHRPGRGHAGDDLHAGRRGRSREMLVALDDDAGQRAAARQGQHGLARRRCASRCAPAPAGSSCTRTGARRRRRSTPACASPTRPACRSRSTPTRSTRPATWSRRSRRSPAGRSTPTTPRAPAAATRRTSSRSPSHPNVLPSSTNPTRPHTVNTVDEHLDMLMVCHHLNPRIPEDLAFAESRIRATTIAAEDVLHDLGAISMIGSDSQAMGRVGETIIRTWQTAHAMKARLGAPAGAADNERARRYVAKYTICPAVAHGIDARGRLGRGRQARRPRALGPGASSRPAARSCSRAARSPGRRSATPNASIPTPQPVLERPMFAGSGRARGAALADVRLAGRRSRRPASGSASSRALVAVADTRRLRKADMPQNDALPGDPRRARHVQGLGRRRGDRAATRSPSCRSPSATCCSEPWTRSRCCSRTRASRPAATRTRGGLERRSRTGSASTASPAFLGARLRLVAAARGALARRGAARGRRRRRRCAELDAERAARCPSPPLRDVAARGSASQLLRTAATVWPGDADRGATAPRRDARRARSRSASSRAAAGARATSDVALLALYDDAATVASAALQAAAARPRGHRALARRAGAATRPAGARAVAADRGAAARAGRASRSTLRRPSTLEQRERLFAS